MTGRKPSATIHLPECRDRYLEAVRDGFGRNAAAESIGCIPKTAQRYISAHPLFAAKVEAAERGEETERESASPAPVALARVIVDAEPVDSAPCDVAKERPANTGLTGLEVFRGQLMASIEKVVSDHEHPAFGRIADLLFKAYYGADLLRAMREAERESSRTEAPPSISAGRARVLEAVTRARQSE